MFRKCSGKKITDENQQVRSEKNALVNRAGPVRVETDPLSVGVVVSASLTATKFFDAADKRKRIVSKPDSFLIRGIVCAVITP